jgi:hypothetical protein
MSDLTSPHPTEWLHFTDRKRREIIVVDVSFCIFLIHIIDELDV